MLVSTVLEPSPKANFNLKIQVNNFFFFRYIASNTI